jgi:hypothetical protein
LQKSIKNKLREWARRYAGPEISGTVTALAAAWTVHSWSHSLAAAAVAGSLAEAIGFYGYAGVREALRHYRRHSTHGRLRRLGLTAWHTVRDMLIEFGPGEALDSLLFRPLFMFIFPQLLHNFALGIIAGKLAADVIFYTSAAGFYELK